MPWETPGRPRTLLVPTPVPPGTAFRRLRSSNPQAGGRPSGEGPRPGLPFPPTEGTNRDGEGPNLPGGDGGRRERPRGGERGQSPTQGLTTRERRANDRTLTRAGGGRPRGPHSPRSGGPPPSPRRCGPRPPPTPDPGAEGDVGRVRLSLLPGRRAGGRAPSASGAPGGRGPGRSPSPVLGLGRRGEPQGRPKIVDVAVSQEPPIFVSILQMKGFFFFFSLQNMSCSRLTNNLYS